MGWKERVSGEYPGMPWEPLYKICGSPVHLNIKKFKTSKKKKHVVGIIQLIYNRLS